MTNLDKGDPALRRRRGSSGEGASLRAELMLKAMLRISPEAIVVTNEEGRIAAFSAGAEAVFGYCAAEVVGRPVEELMPMRFRGEHRRHVEDFAGGAPESLRMHDRAPVSGRRKSGEEFPAEASLAKIRIGEGFAFAAIVRDLTEQQAAERRLIEAREAAEQANLAKSVFLANMSHEIRTPLNGMLGVAGALVRTELTPKQRMMVDLIETSGRALERLLGDVLDLAKLDAGRMSVRAEPFDLDGLVREIVELFRASAAEKGIELVAEVAATAQGHFLGDDLRIRQVLSNLVSNAVKFTAEGEVRLSVTLAPDSGDIERLRFVVRDTGVGFPPDVAETVFERFQQADGSITRRFGGTGLGLAISKSLVGLMGGTIAATSTPGAGATFRFELPLPRADGLKTTVASGVGLAPGDVARPLRVLLAEDHAVNRMAVELILDSLPIDIVAVENGRDALDTFTAQPFDLVLMDMQMPVMDGLSAVRMIRALEAAEGRRPTPICMLTAYAMEERRLEAEAAGADAFLTKPMNAGALIEYVVGVGRQGPWAEPD